MDHHHVDSTPPAVGIEWEEEKDGNDVDVEGNHHDGKGGEREKQQRDTQTMTDAFEMTRRCEFWGRKERNVNIEHKKEHQIMGLKERKKEIEPRVLFVSSFSFTLIHSKREMLTRVTQDIRVNQKWP